MFRIRKDDLVTVICGKNKGKRGKVISVLFQEGKAIVENINLVKKHRRRTREEEQTGVIDIESPIDISNLALICKQCNKPGRFGVKVLNDGQKNRVCKKCGALL